ncbi:MAG: 3alpha(or 20beta)-hydroxysteroid dehydrogenase [Pseudonocardiales bacterium]|nr:3alpha(or 20beta)-hydroxysteroid dehydrogenase [Pseudonocardiales bacterium]
MTPRYPIGNRLEGKVALISGGARGMGESHARALVAQGADVVIADILDSEGEALTAELGDAAIYVHLDVTDRDQWAQAVSAAIERFGKLNVLVNNAGIATAGAIGEYSPTQWDAIIAVNLTGVFNGITASLDALKAGAPSSIINISSTAGLQGYSKLPGYSASKFGVRGLTKSVALDLGVYDVRCNSVHPGAVSTPMTAGLDAAQKHVAMRRLGRPEELSNLIVFLASDESSFSTGAEFIADGGETAGLAPRATA